MNGAKFMLGRARMGEKKNGQLDGVILDDGTVVRGDAYVFACGPWLRKLFPELLENRMRVPLGYVCYFGTPPHDNRFAHPNLPSFNFPGVTGWPTLPVDSRGFRVRGGTRAPTAPGTTGTTGATGATGAPATGANGRAGGGAAPPRAATTAVVGGAPTRTVGASARAGSEAPAAPPRVASDSARSGRGGAPGATATNPANPPRPPVPPSQLDPDLSDRWADAARLEGPRRFVVQRFPLLAEMPLLETRSCHYEQTSSSNFIIDQHPQMPNVWIAGGGNAEGFKFGPVVGEYIAQRVLGEVGDPEIAKGFRIPKDEYQANPPAPMTPPATDSAGRGRGAVPAGAVRPPGDEEES